MSTTGAIRAGKAFVELFADDSRLVRGLRQAEAKVVKFGNNIKAIGRRLMTFGAAASAPFALSTKVFTSFDDQMRTAQAVTGATAAEFEKLTEKAKLLGRTTSFTTAQVAAGMVELGRAGFAPDEIDSAIAGMLDLARATGTDLASATEIAGNTLRRFNLDASEMTRVGDVLVATANLSAQTLTDLGEALKDSGPLASAYGLSIEELCKTLGALANFGIKGSMAGTTMKNIMVRLANSSIQKKFGELGVAVSKAGKMRNIADILHDVGKAIEHLPNDKKLDIFNQLFGLRAIAGGAKLTVAQFDRLNEGIDAASGRARQTARDMDAGLGGSFRMLWSAVEGVAIAIGEALAPSLQKITDYFTNVTSGLVDYITKSKQLVVSVSKTITKILAVGVALFMVGLGFVAVGKTIGIVATTIASFAKAGLLALSSIQLGISMITGVFSILSVTATSLISVFTAVAGGISAVFGGIVTAVGAVLGIVGTVGAAVFSVLGAAISAILSPVGLVIIAIAGIAGACYLAYKNADAIGKVFSNVFGTVKNAARSATSGISKFLSDAYAYLSQFYDTGFLIKTVEFVAWGFQKLGAIIGSVFRFGVSCTVSFGKSLFGLVKTVASVGVTLVKTIIGAISSVIRLGISLGVQIGQGIFAGIQSAWSKMTSLFTNLANIIYGAFSNVVQLVGDVSSPLLKPFQKLVDFVKKQLSKAFSGIVSTVSGVFSQVFSVISGVLGNIVSFARKFFVFEAVVQSVYFIGKAFSTVGKAVTAFFGLCQNAASQTPGIISRIVAWFQNVPGMIGSMFSKVVEVAKSTVSGIGNIFSGVAQLAVNVWSGLTETFSSVFSALGTIVSGFGNFFVTAFANIGSAVEWLREQFGNLCNFATETFSAIATALGRGDIEAALQVVWASLKLIWVKGSNWILSTWYWVVDTLQTAWATCVYKLSEILTNAWYGVQEFWTETVYTMSTIWTEFSSGVVSAWKTAEKAVAKGIGYLMAQIEGLDYSELAKTIDEDYNTQSRQREAEKTQKLNEIQNDRDTKISSLENDREGVLDILKSDFEKNSGIRDAAYQAKLSAQEQELNAAKAAYNEAIDRAKNPVIPEAEEQQSVFDRIKTKVEEVMQGFQPSTDLESKISVSGSFSAAALAGMGQSSTMDRVAKATERSEKHLEKIANKEEQAQPAAQQKKEIHADPKAEQDPTLLEMKNQTRLLRDISSKGGVFA